MEPQKEAKVTKTGQTKSLGDGPLRDKGQDLRARVPNWNPSLVLDGSPLPANSLIRDFQKGKARYVADAIEQALLLPEDMVDLRIIKKHKVFLSLKRGPSYGKHSKLIFFFFFIYIFYFYFFDSLLSFPYRLFKPLS